MVQEAHLQHARPPKRRVRHAGFLLGLGAGALAESVALRGLAGWQGLLGDAAPNPAQGAYDVAALVLVFAGVFLLHRARARLVEPHSGQVLLGSALGGAGALLLAEGLVAHLLLGLHHAGPEGVGGYWDAGYLLLGVVVVGMGARLVAMAGEMRGAEPEERTRGRSRRTTGRVP